MFTTIAVQFVSDTLITYLSVVVAPTIFAGYALEIWRRRQNNQINMLLDVFIVWQMTLSWMMSMHISQRGNTLIHHHDFVVFKCKNWGNNHSRTTKKYLLIRPQLQKKIYKYSHLQLKFVIIAIRNLM